MFRSTFYIFYIVSLFRCMNLCVCVCVQVIVYRLYTVQCVQSVQCVHVRSLVYQCTGYTCVTNILFDEGCTHLDYIDYKIIICNLLYKYDYGLRIISTYFVLLKYGILTHSLPIVPSTLYLVHCTQYNYYSICVSAVFIQRDVPVLA